MHTNRRKYTPTDNSDNLKLVKIQKAYKQDS